MRLQEMTEEVRVATADEALHIRAFIRIFTVDDLQKSISFYEALGFTIDERWEENGCYSA